MKMRLILLIPALVLAYFAGAQALVSTMRSGAPETALSVRPGDGRALLVKADRQWTTAAQKGRALDQTATARRALLDAPLSAAGLRLMGYGADVKGDAKRAEQLNRLATKVNQREKGAQLWLMEANVARNDVKGALARYDIMLATNIKMYEQLFPQLAIALSDPAIREAFIPYIKKTPVWLIPFASYAAGSSPAPDALSYAIRQAGGLPKTEEARNVETALLANMMAKQKFAEARAFYQTLSGADAKVTVSTAFDTPSSNPRYAPMTWLLEQGANVGAALAGAESARELRAYALSGETGLAAYKFVYLAPGTYRFVPRYKVTMHSANARASWALRCMSAADAPVIYQYDMIRSERAAPPAGSFTVAANCGVQRLELSLSGGDDSGGLEIVISDVAIGPLLEASTKQDRF